MSTACVVLAAGLGTRMKSRLPKVLHRLCGVPLLQHVVDTLERMKPDAIVAVVGKHAEMIQRSLRGSPRLSYVIQAEPKGTADALSHGVRALTPFRGTIVVVNGDTPLLTAQTVKRFVAWHRRKRNDLSLVSFVATDPRSYGRIVRDGRGSVIAIVEERDATPDQRNICEVNSGVYAFEPNVLGLIGKIPLNEEKGEYYLTDIVRIASERGLAVGVYRARSGDEFFGINTRDDLERAERLMKSRIVNTWRERGVDFIDATSVFISAGSSIGAGTVIYPNVHIEGSTKIGSGCSIFPNVRIRDSVIEDGATVKDSSVIERSVIRKGASVGPFAHIRPGSTIGERAKIGNFVEVKNARIGSDTKASHLSYLGDATIGKGVNVGAGTITCNYDGYQKHVTTIEDGVFIGSDTQLIAPVTISKGAVIGAGSTITKDVPPYALALSRIQQTHIEKWALRRQKKRQSDEKDRKRRKPS